MSHAEQAEISKVTEAVSAGAAAEVHNKLFDDGYKMPSGGGFKGEEKGSSSSSKGADGSSNGAYGNRCLDIPPLNQSK